MKREILCPSCGAEARAQFPNESPYPGEHVRFVDGNALQQFRCDHCYAFIQASDPCCAFTIWTDAQGFKAWEHEYVAPDESRATEPHLDKFEMDPGGVDWN